MFLSLQMNSQYLGTFPIKYILSFTSSKVKNIHTHTHKKNSHRKRKKNYITWILSLFFSTLQNDKIDSKSYSPENMALGTCSCCRPG